MLFFLQIPKGGYVKTNTMANDNIRAAPRLPLSLFSPTQMPHLAPIAAVGPLGGAVSPSPTHNPDLMPDFILGAVKLEIR